MLRQQSQFGHEVHPDYQCVKCGEKFFGTTLKLLIESVPHFSTDIAAAWLVVEKIVPLAIARGQWFTISQRDWPWTTETVMRQDRFKNGEPGKWTAGFQYSEYDGDVFAGKPISADTAPLAICLAALKAVGYRETT